MKVGGEEGAARSPGRAVVPGSRAEFPGRSSGEPNERDAVEGLEVDARLRAVRDPHTALHHRQGRVPVADLQPHVAVRCLLLEQPIEQGAGPPLAVQVDEGPVVVSVYRPRRAAKQPSGSDDGRPVEEVAGA
jgi:hypothetical protein